MKGDTMTRTRFVDRIFQAAMLNRGIYEEVEQDEEALGQAMGVVVLSSIAAGIGTIQQLGIRGILLGTLFALILWYVWAFFTYWIGTRVLPEPKTRSNHGELLRTIGFSSAPGIIRILAIIPELGSIIFIATGLWMLVAMVYAVKQALDYDSTLRAVGVCFIGWLIQGAVFLVLFSFLVERPDSIPTVAG
jgi:hypothetical protein